MKITFLGTGTSMGIPMIGCSCSTCQSTDSRDKRTRTSVWIRTGGQNIIIDTGIDFRLQALRHNIRSVDTVLFTHHHVDHIFGMDELRPINFLQKKTVDIYAMPETVVHLKRIYPYVFDGYCGHSDTPRINCYEIGSGVFTANSIPVTPIPLFHGSLPIIGYRIGSFAWCTDVSAIPPESYDLLRDLDVIVLGALRDRPHPNHFTLDQAVHEAQKIRAKQTLFVHMSHEVSHKEMLKRFPEGIQPAYDGQELVLADPS
ncbi:MAG: MBL fold metallo-hydrolase [Calditrichaeota bacterium]|nr:MAG: MBL fold metallo-hydrolase [Calditrichota bacterium]